MRCVTTVLDSMHALLGGAALAAVLAAPAPAPAGQGDCAQPVSLGETPTVTDCLWILKTAVGSGACEPECACAPKGTLPASAHDALLCLKAAVGQPVTLNCPCPVSTTTTTTTVPSNVDAFYFPHACMKVSIQRGFAAPVPVFAAGRIEFFIELGSIADRDGDGREDVAAEVFFVRFQTTSPVFGDVTLELADPSIHRFVDHATHGLIEESTNATPGTLDLPPYADRGSANASFDIYLQGLIAGDFAAGRAHHDVPIVLGGKISSTAPAPGELLVMKNTTNVPLRKDSDVSFFGLSINSGDAATLDLNAQSCE